MKMGLRRFTVYPAKTLRVLDIGDFRVVLIRQEHFYGIKSKFDLVVWDTYITSSSIDDIETEDEANRLFEDLLPPIYVEMARRAFGFGARQPRS